MKRWMIALAALLTGWIMIGCEPFDTPTEDTDYKFINKSTETVHVAPTAQSGWHSFTLSPGEEKILRNIQDMFFVFEPRFRVEVGKNQNGRIVFINLKEGTVPGEGAVAGVVQ
jgi:hypothetical protein